MSKNYKQVAVPMTAIKSTVDDIDEVTILLNSTYYDPQGEPIRNAGMIVEYCNGKRALLSKSYAAELLNDGIFQRMNIPTTFV